MTISEIEKGIKDCLDTIDNLRDDLASVERERAHQHDRADRNAAEYAREQKKREQLQAENARIKELLKEVGSLAASRAGRVDVLEAENARLREALRQIELDCDADYPPSHGAIKYAARAVLGETQ